MSSLERTQIDPISCPSSIHHNQLAFRLEQRAAENFNPATLVELLRLRALGQPERSSYAFLEDGEVENSHLTYSELDERARSIAALLQDLKAPGERVLLLYPPGLDYIAAFFGCLYAGAIAVPIYPPRPNRTLARLQEIVADSGATIALTTKTILSTLHSSLQNEPSLEALRWVDTDAVPSVLAESWRSPRLRPDTVAFLQYTSGSTSQPKGVIVTHRNLLYNARMTDEAFQNTEQSIYVTWLPLYHDMGLIGTVLQPLYAGVPSILMSPLAFLQKPFRWLQAISRYKASVSGGPNFAYDLCVRKVTPEQRASLDLSTWQVAFNGAEPVRGETLARFTETFKESGFRPEAFFPCYGLAEATLFVSGGSMTAQPVVQTVDVRGSAGRALSESPLSTASNRTIVGCGRAWLDERIVVVDPDTLAECAPEQVGEIWVAGPHITQGYWNKDEETERTFHAFLADTGKGPFLRTGDLGFIQNGELFVAGRLKDLIIIDGRNHYPQDIEETVERSHPSVRPGCCAAFSIEADCRESLVIVAEIDRWRQNGRRNGATGGGAVPPPGLPPSPESIAQIVRRAVAESHDLYAHSVCLVNVGSVPKTSSGKLRRSACRSAFLAGELATWGNQG